jgi:hypothetical protein
LVNFAVALSFGTWQSYYANAWLQGGSYCTWPGVTCPIITPVGQGCCASDSGSYTVANCRNYWSSFPLAVLGVNCTQTGIGSGPMYGGTPAVYTPTVTGLTFNSVGLRGTLPASFGSGLSSLTSLNIVNEQNLYGTLPASMSGLTSLQQLTIQSVLLNGTFDVFASLPALVSVDFANLRALNAAVPNFVSPFLQTLSIMGSYNTMDSACSVNNVYDLTIPCMSFSVGPLPNWNLPNLTSLALSSLYSNYRYSPGAWIPAASFFPTGWNLPALTSLSLSNLPFLYGSLPAASAFPKLNSLSISSCGINGSLPTLPSSLISIGISATPLTGNLNAVAATQFTSLTSLVINGASMTGSLPTALVPALNKLTTCALTGNGLTCPLPAGLTKLSCNPASCTIPTSDILLYCGAGDDANTCLDLVNFAVALSFGTWQSYYANAWLQGGSYCTWPGVTCPIITPVGQGCCASDSGSYTVANCRNYWSSFPLAVLGVNCTQTGIGSGPMYGGTPAVYTPTVTGLTFNSVGLRGTLPASFGSGLSSLTSLNIVNEQNLYGTLPASMSGLTSLQQLTIQSVLLNGTFDVFASLPALVSVDFANLRALNAAVPNFVSPFLQTLSIMGSYNTMDSACSVNNVYDLTIPCMSFSVGPLPNWNLPNLTSLALSSLYSNYRYSPGAWIPAASFFPTGWNLPALTSLSLSNLPFLYGSLPAASAFPKLNSLSISSCGINGSLPTLPSSLISIGISATPLTGNLNAVAATQFTSLTSLVINGASMTGSLPTALVPALNKLTTCALTGNGLTCPLPAGLTKLSCNPASCAVSRR